VPFLDLSSVNGTIRDRIMEELAGLIESGAFTNGPHVAAFEAEFAAYCGTQHCVGLASGLDALRLALQALEIGSGDEVLVPAHTFVATFEAVSQVGAIPVPVDTSEVDYCIDPDALEAAVEPRTRAVLPVHLYGQLADMAAIRDIAGRHDIPIVEDACQAHGATRGTFSAGAAGHAGAFSFYPGKNLGAFGDAGAVVTNDPELAVRLRALREHGQREKYRHDWIGWTARLDTIQALVLLRKLPLLDGWNVERRVAAAAYDAALAGVGDLRLPPVPAGSDPVWHLYVIRTAYRDELVEHLRSRRIGVGLHYPEPPHLSAAYASLGFRPGSFPVAEAQARELLSLPMFPGISEHQLETVADAVASYFASG
jgi:dTDP-4-amino-4,6-dideoxygalactose transaminase